MDDLIQIVLDTILTRAHNPLQQIEIKQWDVSCLYKITQVYNK